MIWISIEKKTFRENCYYLATRYGIRNIPDLVYYGSGEFYSMIDKEVLHDVAYIMELPVHPSGCKEVINFQPPGDTD